MYSITQVFKTSLCLIILLTGLQIKASAQNNQAKNATGNETKLPSTIFRLSPQHFIISTFHVGVEQFLPNKHSSFVIDGSVTAKGSNNRLGGGGELQFRLYLTDWNDQKQERTKEGFYMAPYAGYQYLEENEDFSFYPQSSSNPLYHYNSYTGGVIFGLQLFTHFKMTFDFFFGGGIKITKDDLSIANRQSLTVDIFNPGYSGVYPKAGIILGLGI